MSDSVVKTARRIFEILEYFDEAQRPLSLRDFTRRHGYPPSSASAVLKSMVVLGYLDFDRDSRTYMPTMRIVELGAWVERALFGEGSVIPLMNFVTRETQETTSVATQSDLYMQYIHVVPSPQTIQFSITPGTIRPIARSGLGWLLLSARPDDGIEKLVRRINVEPSEERVDLPELMERIREIRARGYVLSLHTVTAGAGVIGVLRPGRRNGRTLAIGVGGPVDRLVSQEDQIVDTLRIGIARYLLSDRGRD